MTRLILTYVIDLLSDGRPSEARARTPREVPQRSERQIAFHEATEQNPNFSLEKAAQMYQKAKAK